MKLRTLSVSEVNRYIKNTLESDPIISYVSVKGEISNFKLHSSGHAYFSLKDGNSKLSCVMFKTDLARCIVMIRDGMAVEIGGNISVYERDGRYQLYGKSVVEVGLGALELKYQQLKSQLLELGYFQSELKKAIPKYVDSIGVVTSPTGAAIRDILSVSQRRNPAVEIVIYPVNVQGEKSASDIKRAIEYFNSVNNVDVIVVSRGGGSLEELWSFNERIVADSIYTSKIPIVSAVGHEVDFTIADYTSDLRVPTPSAAAEVLITPILDMRVALTQRSQILSNKMASKLRLEQSKLQRLNELNYSNFNRIIRDKHSILNSLAQNLDKLSPLKTLTRGYSVVTKESILVKSVNQLKVDDTFEIRLKDGQINAKVVDTKEL